MTRVQRKWLEEVRREIEVVELIRDISRKLEDKPEEQEPELSIIPIQNQQSLSNMEPEQILQLTQNEEQVLELQVAEERSRLTDQERLARLEDNEKRLLAEMESLMKTHRDLITEVQELSQAHQRDETRYEEINNNARRLVEWMSEMKKKYDFLFWLLCSFFEFIFCPCFVLLTLHPSIYDLMHVFLWLYLSFMHKLFLLMTKGGERIN